MAKYSTQDVRNALLKMFEEIVATHIFRKEYIKRVGSIRKKKSTIYFVEIKNI